jgi:hypothetical protein
MKKLVLSGAVLLTALTLTLHAADVKITGDATCAKCTLKQADACQMAITYKNAEGKQETLLVDNNKVSKDFHSTICKTTEKVTAEGTISEKDGKKLLTLSKIEEAK